MRLGRVAAGALLAALATGCGYRFAVGGPGLPGGVASVYVPVFANRSADAEAGAIFAQALADSLAQAGRLAGPSASARIDGEVLSVSTNPAATRADGTGVSVYRLHAALRLSLVQNGRTLCVREVAGSEDYLPAPDLLGIEASRREAVLRLARKLMDGAEHELCPG